MREHTVRSSPAAPAWMIAALVACACACACGGSSASGGGRGSSEIRAAIATPPPCPQAPAVPVAGQMLRWADANTDVADAAELGVSMGIEEAERRRDVVWAQCLRDKRHAIAGRRDRIVAERRALLGRRAERAAARIRIHCERVQQLVLEAQYCL